MTVQAPKGRAKGERAPKVQPVKRAKAQRGRIAARADDRRRVKALAHRPFAKNWRDLDPHGIGPQVGFQERFASSAADITIGGGAANCGKSFISLLEAARDTMTIPTMGAVFFRRTVPEITNEGGLWDESTKIYPLLGAVPTPGKLLWRFPNGGRVKFTHLIHEDTVKSWQGAQCPLFIFDELTHFTANQFWYLLSRNRSNVFDQQGRRVRARVLATCNPDADSWVAELIAWWIDQDEASPTYGLPIPERAGVLRYFTRVGGNIVWGDTKAEVLEQAPEADEIDIRSLTFVPGKIEDNPLGDPRYRGQLMALDRVERARLLDGNWKIRATAGDYFRQVEVGPLLEEVPDDIVEVVRRWDFGATEPGPVNKDPDWTFGVKMGRRANGKYVVLHVEYCRKREDDVRALVVKTAIADGVDCSVVVPQDPGQAGKGQAYDYVRLLAGYSVGIDRETGDKETRAKPLAAQWQHGNVQVMKGAWNTAYFFQMEGFPTKGIHDDAVDASAGAFYKLTMLPKRKSMFD